MTKNRDPGGPGFGKTGCPKNGAPGTQIQVQLFHHV